MALADIDKLAQAAIRATTDAEAAAALNSHCDSLQVRSVPIGKNLTLKVDPRAVVKLSAK